MINKRNNSAWEFLGIDTETPYDDEHPLLAANTAGTREYRLRFWDKGAPNGDWSAVQRVPVGDWRDLGGRILGDQSKELRRPSETEAAFFLQIQNDSGKVPAMAKNKPGEAAEARGVHAAATSKSTRALKRAETRAPQPTAQPSALVDTRVIYCGDNLEQLRKLPDACVDLSYIDPPFNSNRNYEVFWGETNEKRAFEDRHASTQAYIDFMRPRCVELARVLKKTGSFYYHCDWHAAHYVKVMLDQIFGEN